MTDTEIIIEVAKLDGLKLTWDFDNIINGTFYSEKPRRGGYIRDLSYLTSRDAIVPVVEKLWNHDSGFAKDFICYLYEEHSHPECVEIDLTDAFGEDLHSITLVLLLSTSRQLCIALLKATGKWKE